MEDQQGHLEEEITLKELILKAQEYGRELIRLWWVVGIFIFLSLSFFMYKAFTTPPLYFANLTFMINEDDGGGLGGMSAILGQFGFGGVSKGSNNLNKILELAKSNRIVNNVILNKIEVNNKEDYIANHIIRMYDFHEKWEDDTTGLKEFYFTKDSFPAFNRTEAKALKRVYRKVVGGEEVEGIFTTRYTEDTGIMEMSVNSEAEELSIGLCDILYANLADFYVNKTIEKQQQTFDVMFEKVDSIKREMTAKEYALASFLDSNRGLLNNRDKLKERRLQRDVQILNEAFAGSLKNFEIADFTLKNKTPFIQLIDEPFAPLIPVVESKLKNLVYGIVLGVMLGFLVVSLRKAYLDLMSD